MSGVLAAALSLSVPAGGHPMAPEVLIPAPETNGASLAGEIDRGWAPPFSASERDQSGAALTVHWSPAPAATFRLHYEWLSARWPDGSGESGSGDIRAGAAGRLFAGEGAIPEVWVDVLSKLPNASDANDLGTDETDIQVGGTLRWELPPVSIRASGGLLILGNPSMFANQDDAAIAALAVEAPLGSWAPFARAGGRLPSPRNPGDLGAAAGAEWSKGALRIGAEGRAGLTAAAADWGGALWLGGSWPCFSCQDD